MSIPKVGEVRAVTGGHGLMLVVKVDEQCRAAALQGHGYAPGSLDTRHWAPHWFVFDRLSEPVGAEVVRKEQAEAAARKVACNSPGCWCLKARITPNPGEKP